MSLIRRLAKWRAGPVLRSSQRCAVSSNPVFEPSVSRILIVHIGSRYSCAQAAIADTA